MHQAGSNTKAIEKFIEIIKTGTHVREALELCGAEKGIVDFVNHTFGVIDDNKQFIQAAVFTFGREDLIPGMFISFVRELHEQEPESIDVFKYYLERHIEVDGDHHSHLAYEMTTSLCGNDENKWQEASKAVTTALRQRINLWDCIADTIKLKRSRYAEL